MWRCTVHTDGGTRTATERMRCSTILQYFFKSRSWRHFYAVIRVRLAENCRGRTTTIICTRTNAPKYILESHRLHFGSICDQNGRNFEPWPMTSTESLSLAPTHPPTHPCTIISCIGDLTGWRYDDMKNYHIAQH